MKNDLTCEVVQDLLPSYVDGLTSDVSNQAVERPSVSFVSASDSF